MNENNFPEKKLPFWAIGKGKLAQQMQKAFEEQSQFSVRENRAAKIVLTIDVYPPDPSEPDFASVSFDVKESQSAKKSMKFTTRHVNGIVVAEGDDSAAIQQLSMEFSETGT